MFEKIKNMDQIKHFGSEIEDEDCKDHDHDKGEVKISNTDNHNHIFSQIFDDQDLELQFHQVETMYPDWNVVVFHSLRYEMKKKYRIMAEEQVSYYFESLFLVTIQVIFCLVVLMGGSIEMKFTNDFKINLAQYFTTLVLHYSCIAIIRNGIQMCKFVVYHSEEFENPLAAFSLGLLVIFGNVLCAVTNGLKSLSYTKMDEIVSKFVAFKILIQIADFYNRARHNVPVKDAARSPLNIIVDPRKIYGVKEDKRVKKEPSDINGSVSDPLQVQEVKRDSLFPELTKE